MIRNNLAILMSERGIRNSYLSAKTGISKNTISATSSNDGKMIQLETINKICQVLQVDPGDFFSYLPYDIQVQVFCEDLVLKNKTIRYDEFGLPITHLFIDKLSLDIIFSKIEISKNEDFALSGHLANPVDLYLENPPLVNIDFSNSNTFSILWKSIPKPFQIDIERIIKNEIVKELNINLLENIDQNDFENLNIINDFVNTIMKDLEIKFF